MTRPSNDLALTSTPTAVVFAGTARAAGPQPLRSPVSGLPCVHWRLRVVENMTPSLQLVHEIASQEPFEVSFPGARAADNDIGRAPLRVRVDPRAARIPTSLSEQGPFRAVAGEPELIDAIVRLETRNLGPALLPWALGTAAALLGVMGGATYAAWRYHVLHLPPGSHLPRLYIPRPELRPPEIPHPRMP